jgi:hypothetical protein
LSQYLSERRLREEEARLPIANERQDRCVETTGGNVTVEEEASIRTN